MKKIIGNPNTFAIEIDIMSVKPLFWGKTALVICNNTIGIFEQENMLGPFFVGMRRIAVRNTDLVTNKFRGLSCVDMFYKIDPFSDNPLIVYDLSDEEFSKYEYHDNMKLYFGENFHDWLIRAIIDDDKCTFIWYYNSVIDNENPQPLSRKDIKCANVNLSEIVTVYDEFCKLAPE